MQLAVPPAAIARWSMLARILGEEMRSPQGRFGLADNHTRLNTE
jgi:hypothetical protein